MASDAVPGPGTARPYRSPLRDRQASATRALILDALTDLLGEHRADEVTTREIARSAGVSERTVYRHFPDREALLVGLSERMTAIAGGDPGDTPVESVDDLKRVALQAMTGFDEVYVVARAEALLNADPRRFSESTRAHSERLLHIVAREAPQLSERQHVVLAAVLRCLLSSQAWLRMREEFGVTGEESGRVLAWVFDALFREIDGGNPPHLGTEGAA